MPRATRTANRTRLIDAALKVTYRNGFAQAALADIARQAHIPLGNVYYYFKTKNEIAVAIIEKRLSRLRVLLQELDKAPSPRERLCGFVQLKIENRNELARTGCPVGTLLSELHKLGSPVAKNSSRLFAQALAWMEVQFQALGMGPDSRGLAVHLLSATQGVSLLAHAFHDPALITAEAERLQSWIRSLSPLRPDSV